MSLTCLPVELLDLVFEPLPPATLAALSCTSVHVAPSASRQLYRHIALSSYARNLDAVHTLASRPHLGALVRTFSITVEDGAAAVEQGYYTKLEHALCGMKDLASLEVHIDSSCSWVLPSLPSTATAPFYPALGHFASSFALDTHVAAFLAGTPSLRSLQLVASTDGVELPLSSIPFLTSYTGPPVLLAQLLPSRPLRVLHLSSDLSLDDIAFLAKAVSAPSPVVSQASPEYRREDGDIPANATIQTLSTITSAPPVAVIEALAQACPDLVSLQVITTCAFWDKPDIVFFARIANALASLPHLSAFELSGMHWEVRPKATQTIDGTYMEKEWVSPPVTPRPTDVDLIPNDESEFEDAFMEWAY